MKHFRSNCCDMPVIEEMDICSLCHEHCEIVEFESPGLFEVFGEIFKQKK